MRRALRAGIPPQRIVFSGVGKTRDELEAALAAGIRQINVKSIRARRLSALASAWRGRRIAIRVNPDVDALTHAKISTGKKENKFGIDIDEAVDAYRLAADLPGIEPVGVRGAYRLAASRSGAVPPGIRRVAELVLELRHAGFAVTRLDLGGGLGIRYHTETPPEPTDYAALVREISERSRSIWRSNPAARCAVPPDCWSVA